jgi:predicted dehydrogenase
MNILIWGLGSVGQRHLRNIKSINQKVNFFAIRKKFETPFLNNSNLPRQGNIKKAYRIKYFSNLKQLVKNKVKIDAAFVCTPSRFHIDQTIELLKKKINVFVEKPLGSDLRNISLLKNILKKNSNLKNMMGFQLKFNPIINKVKSLVEKKFLGDIYSVNINHGEHIDDFHQYESYKKSYAAKKKLGGGVLLTQIHELDYLIYIFSKYKIKLINSVSAKLSRLKIDVEDTFIANLLLSNKKKKLICNLVLSYLEKPKSRKIKIIGSKGKIIADLNMQTLKCYNKYKNKIINFKYSRNDIFVQQVKYFLQCIQNNKKINKNYNILNGIKSLNLALELKKKAFKI